MSSRPLRITAQRREPIDVKRLGRTEERIQANAGG